MSDHFGLDLNAPVSVNRGWVDLVGGLVLALVATWFLVGAMRLPPPFNESDVGAGMFPAIAAATTMFLSLGVAISGLWRIRSGEIVEVDQPLRTGTVILLILGFVWGLATIGLYVTTGAFIVLASRAAGCRNPLHIALTLVLLLGFVWLCFDVALNVSFPDGLLI